jgi:hypothetical protein
MPSLQELRQQYPQYNDLPDDKFVGGFYNKFYSDMPREEFDKKIGYTPSSPLHDFLFGGSTGPGGTIARATQNLPGSAEGVATGLWNAVLHPVDTAKSLWDEASSGFPALRERYGNLDKFQKTFETDPAGTMLDAFTLGKGGSALVRKGGELGARGARTVLPTIGSATSKASAADLRTAGEAGLRGGAEGAEYQAGAAGRPLTSEIKPTASFDDPVPPGLDLGGIKASKVREAQEALARQREAAQAELAPYGQAGRRIGAAGADPTSIVIGGLAGGRLGTAAAATAASPRAMGSAMYGLGAAERGLAGTARAPTRAVIAAGAAALLKDRKAKKELPPADVKTLRAATRDDAGSATMLAASRILGTRPSPYGGSDIAPQYGGIGGDRVATPSPGQPSVPSGGPGTGTGPVPGPAGPGPAGTPPAGPGASPPAAAGALAGDSPLPLPGQSPGLSRVQTTGQEPVAETHGGQTFLQAYWDHLLQGGKEMAKTPREAYRHGLTPEQETDWAAGMALNTMGTGAFAAKPGALGMVGGRLKQPGAWSGAAPHEVQPVSPAEFQSAISRMQETPHGAALDPAADYKGMLTRTTADKTAGYAIEGDNITGVFKHPSSPHQRIAPSLIADAVAEGGRRLDAFDTVLPHLYGENGFRAVARIKFDPAQAPPNWDYKTFGKWNEGKPDVVYMVYDPYRSGYRSGDGKLVSSYEEAVKLQKAEASKIAERMQTAETNFDKVAQKVTGLKGMKEYLTPEELETVTTKNTKNLLEVFNQMPGEEMAAAAYSGRAKRGWYKNSAKALVDVFGIADAPRFTALLAAMSPRVSVEYNTINALRTWNEWKKAGSPTDRQAILEAMAQGVGGAKGLGSVMEAWRLNAIRALSHEDPLSLVISGPKVNSFYRNLAGSVHEVTNDAWMASYSGVKQARLAGTKGADPYGYLGTKSPAYVGMSAAARRAAKILSGKTSDVWTPAEIQETVWSWAKTLKEKAMRGGKNATVEKILKAGDLSHAEIANTPDFATLFTEGIYSKILQEGGYGEAIKRLGSGAAGGGKLPAGTPLQPEAGTFAGPAFKQHLLRAGRRLDRSRAPEPE